MNAVMPFSFDGEPVRAVLIDGEPHLVAKDVADRLGYADAARAIRQHAKGRAKRLPLATAGGVQEMLVLAEPDVLRLIIASKLPAAERFESLVFDEILPAIRRTGTYGVPRDPMEMLNDPKTLRQLLLGYDAKLADREARIAMMEPKVAALDLLEAAKGSLCVSDAAKDLHVAPSALFAMLAKLRWIFRRGGDGPWVAYQSAINAGRLEHRVHTITKPDGSEHVREQVRVTAKGLAHLAELLTSSHSGGEKRLATA